jgi:hypothetical protein
MRGLPRGLSPALSRTSDAGASEACRRRSPPGDTVSGGACARPVRTGKLAAYEPRHCAIPASGSRRRAVRNPPLYPASRAAPPNGASRPEPAYGSAQFHASEVPTLGDAHGRRSDDDHREDHGVPRPRHGAAHRSAYGSAYQAEVAEPRHCGCVCRSTRHAEVVGLPPRRSADGLAARPGVPMRDQTDQCGECVQSPRARVVKLVNTRDLKSLGGLLRLAGSSPAPGTSNSVVSVSGQA